MGAAGPLFVSIGDAEKLGKFLEVNPYVPRGSMFVDDMTNFDAYKAVGLGRFDEVDKEAAKEVKLAAPELGGFGGWWNYMTNVMAMSPIPDDMKFGEVPEGVLRTGGTFVVKGSDVVYQWSDTVPGDHPDLNDVLKSLEDC